ncbi:MAG: FHA domain-containing protein [Thermogemmatispora sp.]|jgi:pSer/pThr/pTyr-binding forkhead associated (FHA) protein|uniref:FHA domain-containing protein n=1 Tax=Thermogemmatispora TaxID=768669 RepID=UPI00124E96D1|nr:MULTISPECIES: FHA domain-containing protein [Thermogemmatispora]MBE3565087.1 FHA domain-containing protein [Thermogemmatispora sp.]
MDKCPRCGAETRPGDRFCLSCGQPLLSSAPAYEPAQTPLSGGDATMPAQDEWGAAAPGPQPPSLSGGGWPNATIPASPSAPTELSPSPAQPAASPEAAVATATPKINNPARFILKSESGEVIQEYTLDKEEITIGRAPTSDILLSKDKLTSRRHATVRYENGQYILRDERSANGTFVNGQQLEELVPYTLKDGDHIGIGEHELIFQAPAVSVDELPTISIQPGEMTYRTREDSSLTASSMDQFVTRTEGELSPAVVAGSGSISSIPPVTPSSESGSSSATVAEPVAASSARESEPVAPASAAADVVQPPASSSADGVTFNRLTSLPLPALPDMSSLMAALATLDGQVSALQEQLNATQEALRNHEAEIAQTANQLRAGVRRVAERMDQTIADVARSREALAWSELIQLMEDVTNNPRDIEYVTRLARKARELNKVFQIHQSVLNTLAECNTLLRALIGEER